MDRGVIATAQELFQCRHYPGVVAVVTDALESEPDCVDLLVIRARAHIKLRRDLDAQADLRDIIRLDPSCPVAFRLLGELAARRDENESAGIFFREALRLAPDDKEAAEWLQIVETTVRPATVAKKLPAPAAAAGRFPVTRAPLAQPNTATGANPVHRSVNSPARQHERPGSQARFARGTKSPEVRRDDGPTVPMARGSERPGNLWTTPLPEFVREPTMDLADVVAADVVAGDIPERTVPQREYRTAEGSSPGTSRFEPTDRPSIPSTPLPLPPPPNQMVGYPVYDPQVHKRRGSTEPVIAPPPVVKPPRPVAVARGPLPEVPGFGEYLVTTGILSRERLRAAQAYQRSMKVQLATAIVTLGLATPQRIEWAAVSHQSQMARDRQAAQHH